MGVGVSEPLDIAWRETWPGEEKPDDICASHNGASVGRVYRYILPGNGGIRWAWFNGWGGPDNKGMCESRREAMLELEARYEAFLARGGKLWRREDYERS